MAFPQKADKMGDWKGQNQIIEVNFRKSGITGIAPKNARKKDLVKHGGMCFTRSCYSLTRERPNTAGLFPLAKTKYFLNNYV